MAGVNLPLTGLPQARRSVAPRLQRLARAVLAWESLWPALWPATCLALVFATLVAFDLLPMLPGWLHASLLTLIAVLFIAALADAVRRFRQPSEPAGLRRLERDSGFAHRPLEALGDGLANPDADDGTAALWAAHVARSAAAIRQLRLAWPRAGLVKADPYGIRVALGLLLAIGVLTAGSDIWGRLGRALHPELGGAAAIAPAGFDVWITPPDYTGLPPIYESSTAAAADHSAPVPVPVGSKFLARVHGGRGTPDLVLGRSAHPFEVSGGTEYAISTPLKETDSLAIRQNGDTLFRMPVRVVPDLPPTAAWRGPAKTTPQSALKLDYTATDDYGVSGLSILVAPVDGHEKPVQLEVPLPVQGKDLKETTFQDLTASPWVGLPVELKLVARDAIGQTGISAPMRLVLPERIFHNPVARAIADQRKLLMRDPSQADIVTETLSDLSVRPDRFRNDIAVFLALRSAADRLQLDTNHQDLASIEALLWDTALRVEDGDVPEAQKTLRQAEQALQQALDRNASDAEVETLMKQLQQAINRYLQAMMADAQRNGTPPQQGGNQQAITPSDIARMLDQARDMARTGARDAAKQALANLQNLLESLRTAPSKANGSSPDGKALDAMRDLARRQQDLLDKSYRAAQRGGQGGEQRQGSPGQGGSAGQAGRQAGAGNGDDLAGQQEALRRQLGDMMRQLGENGQIPQSVGHAERSMNGAAEALRDGDAQGAVGQQSDALDQLQQAMRQLSEKMGQAGGEGQESGGRDPFGRTSQGDIDGGDVKLPTAVDVQRSRQILDELRRRASQWQRPADERDYLNRLLQRF